MKTMNSNATTRRTSNVGASGVSRPSAATPAAQAETARPEGGRPDLFEESGRPCAQGVVPAPTATAQGTRTSVLAARLQATTGHQFISESELDFWNNGSPQIVRKNARLSAEDFRIATAVEKIDTIVEGNLERSKTATPGDIIVTGKKGELYVIEADKFKSLYREDPKKGGSFISNQTGVWIESRVPTSITREDGTLLSAKKGDAIYYSFLTRTVNVVDRGIFDSDYSPIRIGSVYEGDPTLNEEYDNTPDIPRPKVSSKPPSVHDPEIDLD